MALIWCVSFLLALYLAIVLRNYLTQPPSELGFVNQSLSPCPESPNCVCSQDESLAHFINPIPYTGSEEQARSQLSELLSRQSGCRIVSQEGNYLHAEFRSLCFRFVDDVEFLIDSGQNVLHVRSASRVGHYDLGANRQRIEAIRQEYLNGNK
ncbi:DUF1499 domain-containing protein [uncultured Gimesia sp.]|uniref:DUF1499 domain-containing protein n=1 Tax=uncultured Gimesia sp. TaxID=1678688 RepID=UPI0026035EEA|nr:DUF1499 domain-containing protein [uncultured Gimesia sp.]